MLHIKVVHEVFSFITFETNLNCNSSLSVVIFTENYNKVLIILKRSCKSPVEF